MAFFKKVKKKINDLWYPEVVTVGQPISTDHIAGRLAEVSTVSRGDIYAVLKELAPVMSEYMSLGRTVKLEGLGTFYYTIVANGNGVKTPEEVTADLISGVRVRFIPERKRNQNNQIISCSLVDDRTTWSEFKEPKPFNTFNTDNTIKINNRKRRK